MRKGMPGLALQVQEALKRGKRPVMAAVSAGTRADPRTSRQTQA